MDGAASQDRAYRSSLSSRSSNPVEVIGGGRARHSWGCNVFYGYTKDEGEASHEDQTAMNGYSMVWCVRLNIRKEDAATVSNAVGAQQWLMRLIVRK